MTHVEQKAPAGWYVNPTTKVGQRYWDGQKWTEHVYVSGQQYTSPLNGASTSQEEKPKFTIYWSNLFRIRTWFFAIFGPLFIVVLLTMFGFGGEILGVLYLPMVIAFGVYLMTIQMACRKCGSLLRVTRLSGEQEVCVRCHAPTDRALRQ